MSPVSFVRLARYELKYHIHLDSLARIEAFLQPWCGLDPHSSSSPDGFYWVTSLYLDTPRLMLARNREAGLAQHTNLRIRTYGESPAPTAPKHFEIKRWEGDIVEKTRGTIHDGDAASLWQDTPGLLGRSSSSDRKNLEDFHLRSTVWNASPVILTQYRRKAWFGHLEKYARITVDTSLRWREEIGFDFSVHPLQMRPSDPPDNFRPGNHAILELKCDRASVPMWMLDLIRLLELERDGYSKYLAAMRESQLLPSIRGARW